MANTYPNLTRAASRFGVVAFFVVVMSLLFASCVTTSIDAGHRGVKFNPLGGGTDMNALLEEGLQFKLPWEQIVPYSVRIRTQDEGITALSSNGAQIGLDVSVRYRPNPARLPQLHQTYGQAYYEQLVQHPATSTMDHLKLSAFLAAMGVLAGSLGGRSDSRDLVRNVLFLTEES